MNIVFGNFLVIGVDHRHRVLTTDLLLAAQLADAQIRRARCWEVIQGADQELLSLPVAAARLLDVLIETWGDAVVMAGGYWLNPAHSDLTEYDRQPENGGTPPRLSRTDSDLSPDQAMAMRVNNVPRDKRAVAKSRSPPTVKYHAGYRHRRVWRSQRTGIARTQKMLSDQ
jgi:hypothetical protein